MGNVYLQLFNVVSETVFPTFDNIILKLVVGCPSTKKMSTYLRKDNSNIYLLTIPISISIF